MRSALSLAIAAVILLACAPARPDTGRLASASEGIASRTSDERGAGPGSCAYGPWADHCPEAEWARQVLDVAGDRLTGDTGSALVGRGGHTTFYFWAFEMEKARNRPLPKAIEDEGYRLVDEVDETKLFTDGIRLAWQTQGLYVWLEGGPVNSLEDIDEETVRTMVRASADIPYA